MSALKSEASGSRRALGRDVRWPIGRTAPWSSAYKHDRTNACSQLNVKLEGKATTTTHHHVQERVKRIVRLGVRRHLAELLLEHLLHRRRQLLERAVDERFHELGEEPDPALVHLRKDLAWPDLDVHALDSVDHVENFLPERLWRKTIAVSDQFP